MLTLLTISSLISISFALLYLRARRHYQHMASQQLSTQQTLQGEVKALQDRIQADSVDPVTMVLGWPLFEDRVNQGIKECARFKFILGVMYVDIDSFSLINNAMGAEVGNTLLQQTAQRLEGCIRQVDSISRQGKDTFVVLLAQLAKQEAAAIIIQRMLQAMAQPFEIGDNSISVTVGIGAAFYPGDGVTTGDLLHNAEHAMLVAKARGKQTYQFHQEQLLAESQRELYLYNSLSSDSFLDELTLAYQPVMNVEQASLCCIDTKIIWQHSVLGEISGEELFIYADKHRKLNKITERVLAGACQNFLRLQAMGLEPQILAIPVLLKQLENTQFIYKLSHIMQEMNMQPGCVMLEIQESVAPVSLDILEKSFNMLQYLGVKIAIDRFGSGSFSLRYLKAFSVHYLKLDPAIISNIVDNDQAKLVLNAVAVFAKTLTLDVIATGVESEAQATILKGLGINLMQGRLVGEPLSEADLAGKMTKA